MDGLVVYVKERLPFARDLSLENSADSCLCFRLALLHSVSYFFFLYRSPSSALCTVFDSISSNIDEVLSINPSSMAYLFWCKWQDWIFGSLTVTLTVLLFWIYLFLLTLVFVLQWLSLHWEILIMLLSQFTLTFQQTQNWMHNFISEHITILKLIETVIKIIWEMFHGKISLNLVLLVLILNFVYGFRLELMYVFLIISIRSNLTHPNGFQLLVLLP